jgi:hypothetical protein
MKLIVYTAAALALLSSCQSSTNQTQAKADSTAAGSSTAEWTPLFANNSTAGWHAYGKTAPGKAWQVKDGILHLDASQKADWQTKDGGDLISNEEYENFDLKVDWKISPKGNSGIMFYVHEDTTKFKYPWQSGPETQIADNIGNEDGRRPKRHAGDLYDMISLSKDVTKPAGEWNQTEVIANNGHLDILVNQQKVLTTTLWDEHWKQVVAGSKFKEWPGFGTYKKGHIALQDHGADVWFRNVQIKRL